MRTIIKQLLLILLLATSCRATTVQLTGTIMNPVTGQSLNGSVCLKLPVNAVDTSTNKLLTALPGCFNISTGALPAFASVVPNDVIQPQNTYYVATFKDRYGAIVAYANYFIPTAGGTFNLGQAVPTTITTSNISYINPALLNVTQIFTAPQTFPLNSIAVNELTPGANGTCLQTVASAATWVSCAASGSVVSVNAAASIASPNFGNLPAAAANNLLGVWQQSGNNVSVQVPVSGNGAKAASTTGALNTNHSVVIDANANFVDSGVTNLLVQNTHLGSTSCTTGSSSFSQCNSVLTWPTAWADTAYRVTCSGITPSDGRAAIQGITGKTTTTVTVGVVTNGSVAVNYGDIECNGSR